MPLGLVGSTWMRLNFPLTIPHSEDWKWGNWYCSQNVPSSSWTTLTECWNHWVWKVLKWQGQASFSLDVADGFREWIRYFANRYLILSYFTLPYFFLFYSIILFYILKTNVAYPSVFHALSVGKRRQNCPTGVTRVEKPLKSFIQVLIGNKKSRPHFQPVTTRWCSRPTLRLSTLPRQWEGLEGSRSSPFQGSIKPPGKKVNTSRQTAS